MANFDEQLAKLGYQANSPKPRRSHHKKAGHGGEWPRTVGEPKLEGE
jgi:hypothetical protein